MLEDDDLMPWGKYKDSSMQDVPAEYLLYMYKENKCCNQVKQYVADNLDVLKKNERK